VISIMLSLSAMWIHRLEKNITRLRLQKGQKYFLSRYSLLFEIRSHRFSIELKSGVITFTFNAIYNTIQKIDNPKSEGWTKTPKQVCCYLYLVLLPM
jgi:hypothetical protein